MLQGAAPSPEHAKPLTARVGDSGIMVIIRVGNDADVRDDPHPGGETVECFPLNLSLDFGGGLVTPHAAIFCFVFVFSKRKHDGHKRMNGD